MLCAHWVQNARWPFLYRSSSSAVGNIIRSLALARMFLTCLMVDMEDLRSSRTCSSRAHSHRAPSPSSLFSWHLSSQFTVRLAFMFKGMNEITAARTKQLCALPSSDICPALQFTMWPFSQYSYGNIQRSENSSSMINVLEALLSWHRSQMWHLMAFIKKIFFVSKHCVGCHGTTQGARLRY